MPYHQHGDERTIDRHRMLGSGHLCITFNEIMTEKIESPEKKSKLTKVSINFITSVFAKLSMFIHSD